MPEVIPAFVRAEALETFAEERPERLDGSADADSHPSPELMSDVVQTLQRGEVVAGCQSGCAYASASASPSPSASASPSARSSSRQKY